MVDASDKDRFEVAKKELIRLANDNQLIVMNLIDEMRDREQSG